MSTIPAAGVIDVPDAPKLTSLEFLGQVVENIRSQISSLNDEIVIANYSENDQVRFPT
jgi:hypothetical protein